MHALIVIGTRPEAIKLLPVYRECVRQGHTADIYFTVQHEDLVDPLLEMFDISRADCLLPSTTQDQDKSLIGMLAGFSQAIHKQLTLVVYDVVIVQGDTTTTLSGALAAAYAGIPVAHIEAGLRSHDKRRPFPEEINRCLVTQTAALHFAPTSNARSLLLKEGVHEDSVHIVGNTGIDFLSHIKCSRGKVKTPLTQDVLQRVGDREVVLVTGHRRENQDQTIGAVCREISRISIELRERYVFIYVTHPSPKVRSEVDKHLSTHEACIKVPALGYLEFMHLMSKATLIITDSGGVQEEAPSFGAFTIVTRDSTERSESLALGYSELVGDNIEALRNAILRETAEDRPLREYKNPYGDGASSRRIIPIIDTYLRKDNICPLP